MPETITRQERLDAIRQLLPPRRTIEGRLQPYNSKIYNTVLDLLDMVEQDATVIHGLNLRVVQLRHTAEGSGKFPELPVIPKPSFLTVDERAHTLLHLAWTTCVTAGASALAREIQQYLVSSPQVVQENLST